MLSLQGVAAAWAVQVRESKRLLQICMFGAICCPPEMHGGGFVK